MSGRAARSAASSSTSISEIEVRDRLLGLEQAHWRMVCGMRSGLDFLVGIRGEHRLDLVELTRPPCGHHQPGPRRRERAAWGAPAYLRQGVRRETSAAPAGSGARPMGAPKTDGRLQRFTSRSEDAPVRTRALHGRPGEAALPWQRRRLARAGGKIARNRPTQRAGSPATGCPRARRRGPSFTRVGHRGLPPPPPAW